MADIELSNVSSGYNVSKVNDNFETIQDELNNNVMKTDGSQVMTDYIDMNSNRIVNIADAELDSDAINLGQVKGYLEDISELAGAVVDGAYLYSDLKAIARALNVEESTVIYSTDTTTVLDGVGYIYNKTTQTTYSVPELDGTGETIVSVTDNDLVTSAGSYTLSMASTKNNRVKLSDFGNDSDSFVAFMADPRDKIFDVDCYTSLVGKMASNTNLIGSPSATLYATADMTDDPAAASANQGQVIELGDNCTVTGLNIDGQGNKGAGMLNNQKENCTVQLCNITNGTGQAIHDYIGVNSKYADNELSSCQHGLQLWLTKRARVHGNHVYQVTGGIWTAAANDVLAWGNDVHDCSDVGIDWEGGTDCHSFGNTLKSCANGALAIFNNGTGATVDMGRLSHKNNEIVHTATYLNRTGVESDNTLTDTAAMMIYTLDSNLVGPITFHGNTVNVIDSTAANPTSLRAIACRSNSVTFDEFIEFTENKIYTKYSSALRLQELYRLNFIGNEIHYIGADPTNYDEFKNHHHGFIQDNKVYLDEVTPNDQTWFMYTDESMDGKLEITGNEFYGAGDTAIYIDQYVSNRNVKVSNNRLTDATGTTTGGLDINNGTITPTDQRIIFSISDDEAFDLSTKTVLTKSKFYGIGQAAMQMGGANGPIYRVAVQCRYSSASLEMSALDAGGAVSTGIFPDAARYMDFSGTTMMPQDSDGSYTNSAVFSIDLNYRP